MANGGPGPRVLVVATKCPWPAIDGGRLVLAETLRALTRAGVEITLVSPPPRPMSREAPPESRALAAAVLTGSPGEIGPETLAEAHPVLAPTRSVFVPRRPVPWLTTLLHPATPATLVRQADAGAIEAVERLVSTERFDVAHAEQLQALPMLEPARRRGIPIVLRAQNVESDLWAGAARVMPIGAPWLLLQAALLRRWEGRAVARVAATAALTARDADRLRGLARRHARADGEVVSVPAPFPSSLPTGLDRLAGDPALVLAAGGWIPNRDGARWFLRQVWPLVRERLPGARLHVFGAGGARLPAGAQAHAAPTDSTELFPGGSLQMVALRVASGVRMKILEAWARGVPVVATAAAAAGLEQGASAALLAGKRPAELVDAVCALDRDPELARRVIEAGRGVLARRHDVDAVAGRWLELYRDLGSSRRQAR